MKYTSYLYFLKNSTECYIIIKTNYNNIYRRSFLKNIKFEALI